MGSFECAQGSPSAYRALLTLHRALLTLYRALMTLCGDFVLSLDYF